MKPLNIIVAEDNDDHAEMIVDALQDYNPENKVIRFRNGEQLISHLQDLKQQKVAKHLLPNLILLDIKMPLMDGFEALKLIKDDETIKHIPIMMVSTSENALDIEQSYKYGANSYIVKPFDYTDFTKKIVEVNRFWAATSELPKP
ncbi:response regulator [uncultured Paraglaciecola sp.]|uniref:response regulator n=1 Tax=uncultured Paraglaciecola sp. TaxID=1765024 RepID=UPI0030D8042C|tara:strand:- start:74550 stop:74984 length:435 start_codon:yes stop_codon:yes gene_type:complete